MLVGRSRTGRGKRDREDGCLVIFLVSVAIFILYLCCGCGFVSRQLVGTEETHPPKRVLMHQQTTMDKGIVVYKEIVEKITDDKNLIKIANLVDDELKRQTTSTGGSNIARIGNTLLRFTEQPEIRKKVEEGFQFGMNALTMAMSGGIGGTGLIGGLFARSKVKSRNRINKEVKKNRIKTKILNENPEMLKKVNEAAMHTDVEGIIT